MRKPPPPAPPPKGHRTRQALAYTALAAVYYLLAVYAASVMLPARTAPMIWPAHGLVLGTLLVSPGRRWPVYLAIVVLDTILVGAMLDVAWTASASTAAVNVAHPLVVAIGLARLAGPQIEIGTLRGL